MRDIMKCYEEARNIVKECNIPDNFNIISVSKLRSDADRYGECILYRNSNTAKIKINPALLDESKTESDYSVINTMIHEILHACANFEDRHGGLWRKYADKVSAMTEYKINVTSTDREEGMSEAAIQERMEKRMLRKNRYIISCSNPNCDCKWGFGRMCDKVQNPSHYRCGKCKSVLERTV